jgi:hypothetical protein
MMTDSVALCFLVEGSPESFHIFVPYDSNGNVEDLRKIIFECGCKHLTDGYIHLTLSKVSILVSISSVRLF